MDAISMKPNSANEHNRFGSSQVGQSLGLRKRGWELWTGFVLQQYKADEVIDIRTVKALFAIYFIIIGVGLTDWQGFDQKIVGQSLMQDSQLLAVRAVLFGLSLCVCVVHLAAFFSRQPLNAPPNLWTRISSIAKHLQWYIVMPLSLVLFRLDLFATTLKSCQDCTPATSGEQIFSWLLILLNLGLCTLNVALKCELPTRGKLNSPSRLVQPAHYTVLMLLMLIGQNLRESTTGSVFQIASKIIGFSMIVVCWRLQVFWWYEVNTWYIVGHLGVFCLRLTVLLVLALYAKPGIVVLGICICVFQVLILKIGHNLCVYRLQLALRWAGDFKNLENFTTFFTCELAQNSIAEIGASIIPEAVMFELLQVGRMNKGDIKNPSRGNRYLNINEITTSRNNLTPRYDGLLSSSRGRLEFSQATTREIPETTSDSKYDHLWEYYKCFKDLKSSRPEELWILLLLQLIFLRRNLLEISLTLSRYRKSLGSWADYSLNLFLIETMLRSRLETISMDDSKDKDQDRSTMTQIFSSISTDVHSLQQELAQKNSRAVLTDGGWLKLKNSTTKQNTNSLDIDLGRILACKHEYLTIISGINWFLDVKSDIFSMLFETYAHKSHFLYRRNALARKLTTQIDKAILKLMSWPRVPNYVFSAGMAYFLKVRFDLQKSEKIFKIYKANIFKYQTIANRQVKDITEENFMYNSVIMKIRISQDLTLGAITDITPNYMEHMGEPVNEDPLKVNLNSLFAGKMMQVHTNMMKIMSDQHIFNRQKDFQMNGFDGNLRPMRFTLKLDSDVSNGLHAVALIKFFTNKHRHLLLVDQELNIVSAERGFWSILEGLRAFDSGKNLWSLSQSLAVNMLLAKYLRMPIGQDTYLGQSNQNLGGGPVSTPIIGPGRDGNSSSAQNNFVLRQLQQAGQQRFGTQAYTLMKEQVTEYFRAYEQTGIVHPINDELGIPGLPIFTKAEFTQFGEDEYYRVWVSFDLNYNNDTRNLMTTQLAQEETKMKVPTPVLDYRAEDGAIKLSESETKDKGNVGIQETIGSGGFQMLASIQNEFRGSRHTFEQILQYLKTETPIVTLITEALSKDYPEEIKTALSSLKQYLRNIEVSEVHHKGEHRLSAVIRQMTPQKIPSFVSQTLIPTQEIPNLSEANIGQESPILATHPAIRPVQGGFGANLFRPAFVPAKSIGVDDVTPKVGLESHNPSAQTSAASNNVDGLVIPRTDQDTGSATHSNQMPRPKIPKSGGDDQDKKRPVPVIKVKTSKTKGSSVQRESSKVSTASRPDLRFAQSTSFSKALKHAKTDKPGNPARLSLARRAQVVDPRAGLTLSNQVQITNRGRQNTVEEVEERLEVSGTDHKTNKTSLVSQLAKRLFRYRSVRNATNDNSRAHSDKKRNELNPLAISAMAKADAFISQNETNLKLIGRYINDFKAVRRADLSPDEKNNSVTASNTSSSSRGSYFFKTVTSTLETSKRGSFLYLYTFGLILFSAYFLAIFQFLVASLAVYNTSTLNSFNMVNNFITIDRKLVQSCEVQDYLYGLSSGLFNKADYMYGIASFARLLPSTNNGSNFLLGQLRDIRVDIYTSIQAIIKGSISSIDKKDLENVNSATYQNRYLTHWGNLTTPGVYEEWTMPYFTVLMYYCNILNSNYNALRDLNLLAWSTDYTFTMNRSLQMRYDRMLTSRTAMDLRIYDKVMKEKDDQFDQIINDVIVTASERHFAPIYIVLYLSVAVSVCMLFYMSYTWLQINANNSDYLENYNLLRPWELYFILEDNEKVANLFTVYCLNEIQMLNQYMDFMYLTKLTALAMKVSKLEQKFSREKDKMMSSYKFSHDFQFFSSLFGFFIVMLSWLILALAVITFSSFIGVDDRRLGMEKLYFDSHRNMLRTTKYFLSAPLLTTYGYAIPVSGENIASNPFTDAIDNFVAYHAIAKQNYSLYFEGLASLVERINFGDICGLLQTNPILQKAYGSNYNLCKTGNMQSGSRGLLGFLQYEKSFIEMLRIKIRANYSDWLEQSKTTVPSTPLFRELFEPQFLELRVGHRLMFNIYYQVMGQIVVDLVTSIKSQLDYFDEVVMQSICIVVYIGLVASFVWLLLQQREELEICYETFRIIDPFFVLNNRYLQFKFRAAFKGVE